MKIAYLVNEFQKLTVKNLYRFKVTNERHDDWYVMKYSLQNIIHETFMSIWLTKDLEKVTLSRRQMVLPRRDSSLCSEWQRGGVFFR